MPSAPQKRLIANGRSDDATSTVTPGSAAAFSLNFFVSSAHTPVSRLGTVSSTSVLPAKSFFETADRSCFTSVKSGALPPFAGSSPARRTGLPFNVTAAMSFLRGVVPVKRGMLLSLREVSHDEEGGIPRGARALRGALPRRRRGARGRRRREAVPRRQDRDPEER